MLPILSVLSFALGTLWADCIGTVPVELVTIGLVGVFGSFWGLSRRFLAESRSTGRLTIYTGAPARRYSNIAPLMALASLSFLLGFERMQSGLLEGHLNRELAESETSHGIRLADGRVRTRRPGVWGDEVELEEVRAIDGGGRIPARLLLRLDRRSSTSTAVLDSRADKLIWPGQRLQLGLRIRPLHPTRNPGTPDRERIYARRHLGAQARLVHPDWIVDISRRSFSGFDSSVSIGAKREQWRRHVAENFDRNEQAGGLVRALALGDRAGISMELRSAFRRLGLSHLLAISGLHVGFIAGFAGWIFLRVMLIVYPGSRKLSVFSLSLMLAGIAVGAYAWTTQAGVSVERASLLFGLYAVFRLTLRRIKPVEALAWVALAILFVEPSALFDLGAQLSFTACLALVGAGFWQSDAGVPRPDLQSLASPHEKNFVSGLWDTVRSTLRASLAISVATAPLLAQFGLPLVPLAPLFNVVAIPWTGLVVLPTSLMAVATLDIASPAIHRLLFWPAMMMQDAVLKAANVLPDAPTNPVLSMPFLLVLIAISFRAIQRKCWRMAMLLWGAACWAGASPLVFTQSMGPLPRVIFFDVGQGDATLFQGREAVMLIDTGPGLPNGGGGASLIRALRAAGVDRIDVLALTHADLDHRGGLLRVLETIPVEELWLPDRPVREEMLDSIARIADRLGTKVIWQEAAPMQQASLTRGDLEIDVLWPVREQLSLQASRNQASLVLRVELGGQSYLMAADIGHDVERKLVEAGVQLDADVLKVAHHGSRRSSDAEFLARVSPSIAVLSAPCYASRGLPTKSVLSRLRQAEAVIGWTGRDGAVLIGRNEEGALAVSSWGPLRACLPR
ncbi:MAG TPA: DNA internalization-related competence protein ComEC/Rec2 [Myxococcales bacterium]|nr:DNA internalization-related competence protein ComEC/Rec2 [Myxococcales bacterium]HIK85435.1 DNA internalization-related competence protein ComEC/Rec2 [Myxococcales bacterium]